MEYTQMYRQWFSGSAPLATTPAKTNCFIVLNGVWYIYKDGNWYTMTPALVTGGGYND